MSVSEKSMTDKPWVSFCMSTYKRPVFLYDQISSLLKQTFTAFEIVISDNDPEGSGEAIVKQFSDARIDYQVNPENLGMVKSFNNSVKRARGEYIVMITDDDPVYPDMLQTLYDLSLKYPGYGAYHGGCEILCYNKAAAHALRSRIGINSCLTSELDYNEVKIFSATEFPFLFFTGKMGTLLLWSVGVIKKEIVVKNGGMPDYGTEYLTDQAYTVVNCSEQGVVYINRALGHQAVHGENFGFSEIKSVEKYRALPDAFSGWIKDHLGKRTDWLMIEKDMHSFLGRSMVEFSFFIKKSLKEKKLSMHNFNLALKDVFAKPYLRKWKIKYILISKYPATFQYVLQLKQKYFN